MKLLNKLKEKTCEREDRGVWPTLSGELKRIHRGFYNLSGQPSDLQHIRLVRPVGIELLRKLTRILFRYYIFLIYGGMFKNWKNNSFQAMKTNGVRKVWNVIARNWFPIISSYFYILKACFWCRDLIIITPWVNLNVASQWLDMGWKHPHSHPSHHDQSGHLDQALYPDSSCHPHNLDM